VLTTRLATFAAVSVLAGCAGSREPFPSPDMPTVDMIQADIGLPKVARIVSSAGSTLGRICYAAVETVDQGIPATVRVLRSTTGEALCVSAEAAGSEAPSPAMARLRQALAAADRPAPTGSTTEAIAPAERAVRILAPVPVTQQWVDNDWVFVPTAGLNYAEHAAEVGISGKKFLFPKPTAPTSAYADVPQVPRSLGSRGLSAFSTMRSRLHSSPFRI
jgi:hypothetical protein